MENLRDLSGVERELLDGLLGHDFPGAGALREQAPRVRARVGCSCGCGTIDLVLGDDGLAGGSEPSISGEPSSSGVEGRADADGHGNADGGVETGDGRWGFGLSEAESPVPVGGEIHDDGGEVIGGLLLFLQQGRLGSLEVYSYGDDPLPMPDPSRVTWSKLRVDDPV